MRRNDETETCSNKVTAIIYSAADTRLGSTPLGSLALLLSVLSGVAAFL